MPVISYTEFRALRSIPLIDVRSPAEYKHAHIPGAVSLPLFSDEERARVGTIYKQKGKEQAVMLGLEIIGPRLQQTAAEMTRLAGSERQIGVYCWRGGMRSGSMGWLAETVGIRVWRLNGGYKAYRHVILQTLAQPMHLEVLGGRTGSGKTRALQHLRHKGEQVLDLEALANHKGSAFGHIGESEQPGNEMMENRMGEQILEMDTTKRIWVEDESKNIGSVFLNHSFFQQMSVAPLHILDIPFERRADHLMQIYGQYPVEELTDSLQRIRRRLGPERYTMAEQALIQGNIRSAIDIVLEYYDKMYEYQLSQKKNRKKTTHNLRENEDVISFLL